MFLQKLKMEELNKKELSQWEKYSEEEMPKEIFEKLNAKVLKEKDEVQQALCKAYESMPEPVNYEEKIVRFKDALEALKNPDVDAVYIASPVVFHAKQAMLAADYGKHILLEKPIAMTPKRVFALNFTMPKIRTQIKEAAVQTAIK